MLNLYRFRCKRMQQINNSNCYVIKLDSLGKQFCLKNRIGKTNFSNFVLLLLLLRLSNNIEKRLKSVCLAVTTKCYWHQFFSFNSTSFFVCSLFSLIKDYFRGYFLERNCRNCRNRIREIWSQNFHHITKINGRK